MSETQDDFAARVEAKAREMCAAAGMNPDDVLATAPGSEAAAMVNWHRFRMPAIHAIRNGPAPG